MLSERLKKVLKKNNKKNQTLGLFVEMKMETSDHSDMHSNHSLVSHIIASNVEPTKKNDPFNNFRKYSWQNFPNKCKKPRQIYTYKLSSLKLTFVQLSALITGRSTFSSHSTISSIFALFFNNLK